MRKKIQSARIGSPSFKGLKGIAQSFVNVGIPVIVETQIKAEYTGISAQLIQNGNIPHKVSSNNLKIKL